MSHVNERLRERAGFEQNQHFADIVTQALDFGEELLYNKRGMIYKVKFQGKTIYPVITDDGALVTILAEDMVRKDLHNEKYGKKKR
jgi:hypothetical protein